MIASDEPQRVFGHALTNVFIFGRFQFYLQFNMQNDALAWAALLLLKL